MNVFRLHKEKYRKDLSGEGAQIAGGRWNSVGVPMIYTSQSRSLSTAEVAVNLPLGDVPGGFEITTINIPDDCKLSEILIKDLPPGWKAFPPTTITQKIGDQFIIQGKYLVMKVPSAVVPGDSNYLINPRHPDFHRIEIIKREPYEFDERFVKRTRPARVTKILF